MLICVTSSSVNFSYRNYLNIRNDHNSNNSKMILKLVTNIFFTSHISNIINTREPHKANKKVRRHAFQHLCVRCISARILSGYQVYRYAYLRTHNTPEEIIENLSFYNNKYIYKLKRINIFIWSG